jgi:hypothetical protein
MVFILWNYVLPHLKPMPSPWLELVPPLIVGIIDWVTLVPNSCPLFFVVTTYLCPPLSLYCPVFRVSAISRINCLLVSFPLRVIILLNICMPMFRDHPRFPLLMANAIMYFLLIISPSTAGSFLCITSRMCFLFLFTLPLWLKIILWEN